MRHGLLVALLLGGAACSNERSPTSTYVGADNAAKDDGIRDARTEGDTALTSDHGTSTDAPDAPNEMDALKPEDGGSTDAARDATERCPDVVHPAGGAGLDRTLPAFADRPYHIHVPTNYECEVPLPALLVLHGGGSNAEDMPRVTCPTGDLTDAECMNAYADGEGFIVVYPNGTPNPVFPNVRTFNAGGGSGGYICVSGYACNQGVDDLPYFDALLDDLAKTVAVDKNRIYATGISNGAAMSHRLACERADRIAAIAPVAGANQLETTGTCSPSRPTPVFAIHGVEDPSWPYAGGPSAGMPNAGSFAVVGDTMSAWETRHGCSGNAVVTDLPDVANDGTTIRRLERDDCPNVVLFEVVGGGHTWPGGFQYFDEMRIGRTSRDASANALIWESVSGVSL